MEQKISKEFIIKIAEIQSEMKVKKSKENKHNHFSYRTVEDIYAVVRPLLKKQGLAIKITDELSELGSNIIIKATATITDGENEFSNTAYAGVPTSRAGMDASQVFGSASTYARKYALGGLLLVGGEDDPDSKDNRQETAELAPAPKPEKAKPKPQPAKFQINPEDRQKIADFLLDKGISPDKIQIRLNQFKSQAEVDEIISQIEKGAI